MSAESPASTPTAAHGVFKATGSMLADATDAVLLSDRTVLTVGLGVAQIYDPASGSFRGVGIPAMQDGEFGSVFSDGRVVVISEIGNAGLYDPGTNTFKPANASRYVHAGGAAISLDGTHFLLVAGEGVDPNILPRTAEIFDETTGKFTITGSMSTGRDCPAVVRLQTGKVLVAGGDDGSSCVENTTTYSSAELYDPATGKFSLTGSMTVPRNKAQAVLLNNGKVLVMGGFNYGDAANDNADTAGQSAELYDPASGTFTPTGSMAEPRTDFTATLLSDGRVLVVGGLDHGGNATVSAEIYDPATGVFSPTAKTIVARDSQVAVLLADGRVLLAGDSSVTWGLTAELYWP